MLSWKALLPRVRLGRASQTRQPDHDIVAMEGYTCVKVASRDILEGVSNETYVQKGSHNDQTRLTDMMLAREDSRLEWEHRRCFHSVEVRTSSESKHIVLRDAPYSFCVR